MGILRADILTHSQLESAGGSVDFDGSGDYLTLPNHSAFHFTGDYTIDFYIKFSTNSGTQRIFGQRDSGGGDISVLGEFASNNFYYYYSTNGSATENVIIGSYGTNIELNTWHHVAIVSDGGTHHSYLDGVLTAVNASNSPPLNDGDSTWSIGRQGAYTANEFSGSIYGFRITNKALYKNNFTLSKFKPKVLPETTLLCCVSSTSVTEKEVSVAGDITSNGDPQVSADTPLLKEDITDTGVVFDGFGSFATSTYMVPPSGKTTERNRGRALIMAGGSSPGSNNQNAIQYFNISTLGNAQYFGTLTVARRALQGLSSSTRGLALGGFISPPATISDTIDFVTFASTGNGTDFGNLTSTAYAAATASNDTRGLFAGGYRPNNSAVVDSIDYVTIATAGNAADFGDLLSAKRANAGGSNTTRAVFAGGTYPAVTDVIQYVTIATTGNATDFGDLTVARDYPAGGGSSSTRTCFAGGRTPSNTNVIDFITTATTGNATDFGDSQSGGIKHGLVSNRTRGVICSDATITNTLEYITFATTGDALDFGDQGGSNTFPTVYSPGACSDSHGGLS